MASTTCAARRARVVYCYCPQVLGSFGLLEEQSHGRLSKEFVMSGRLLRIIFLLLTICIPLVALAGCVGESPAPTANQPGTANYIDLGIAAHNKGDYDQAIAYYNQAITLEPTDATAFFDRASAYDAKGDDKKAAEDYSQAIKLKPD